MSMSATPIARPVGPCLLDPGRRPGPTSAPWLRVPVRVSRSSGVDERLGLARDATLRGAEHQIQDDGGDEPGGHGHDGHVPADRIERVEDRGRVAPHADDGPHLAAGDQREVLAQDVPGRQRPADRLAQGHIVDAGGRRLAGKRRREVRGTGCDDALGLGPVRRQDPTVRQPDLDPEDVARATRLVRWHEVGQSRVEIRLSFGRRAGRAEVVEREAAGDEHANERRVGADRRREGGRRNVSRNQRRLGDRREADDHQEDPVDEDQQDGAWDSTRGPEHGLV